MSMTIEILQTNERWMAYLGTYWYHDKKPNVEDKVPGVNESTNERSYLPIALKKCTKQKISICTFLDFNF